MRAPAQGVPRIDRPRVPSRALPLTLLALPRVGHADTPAPIVEWVGHRRRRDRNVCTDHDRPERPVAWTGALAGWQHSTVPYWIRDAPRWVVVAVGAIVVGLLIGTATHVSDLIRAGVDSYPWAPHWLNVYWAALAIANPVAVALLVLGRRSGIDLACVIMVTDVAANWYAVERFLDSDIWLQPGLQRLVVFAVFVLVTAPLARPRLRAVRSRA